ncbi:hypothetical protein KJ785_04845 [Patescibacteria group bacterium]|nr:hypothetical protein [Patescibacteria group bacterium]
MRKGIFDEETGGLWAMVLFGLMVLLAYLAFVAWLPSQATAQELPAYARAICEAECPTGQKEIHLMIPDGDTDGVVIEIHEKGFLLFVHEKEGTQAWTTSFLFPMNISGWEKACVLKANGSVCPITSGQTQKLIGHSHISSLMRIAVTPKKWKATASPDGVVLWLNWTKVETYVQPAREALVGEQIAPPLAKIDRSSAVRCDCDKWRAFLAEKKFYREWGEIDKLPVRFVGSENFQVPTEPVDPNQPW